MGCKKLEVYGNSEIMRIPRGLTPKRENLAFALQSENVEADSRNVTDNVEWEE